jgi:hypothetical protein
MTALVFAPGWLSQDAWRRKSAGDFAEGQDRRIQMASILPFIRRADAVFDDRATQIMGEAFDSACQELHDTGQPAIVYEVIAKRIIDAARAGERDLVRLRNTGLSALGFNNDDKEAS